MRQHEWLLTHTHCQLTGTSSAAQRSCLPLPASSFAHPLPLSHSRLAAPLVPQMVSVAPNLPDLDVCITNLCSDQDYSYGKSCLVPALLALNLLGTPVPTSDWLPECTVVRGDHIATSVCTAVHAHAVCCTLRPMPHQLQNLIATRPLQRPGRMWTQRHASSFPKTATCTGGQGEHAALRLADIVHHCANYITCAALLCTAWLAAARRPPPTPALPTYTQQLPRPPLLRSYALNCKRTLDPSYLTIMQCSNQLGCTAW